MSTLEKIVKIKREKINLLKSSNNFTDHFITNNTKQYKQSFFDNLSNSTDKYKIIAEIKKGSPSAGIILDDFDPLLCAKQYIEKGYKNLSVLTEEDHFFGSHVHIESIIRVLEVFDLGELCYKHVSRETVMGFLEVLSQAMRYSHSHVISIVSMHR